MRKFFFMCLWGVVSTSWAADVEGTALEIEVWGESAVRVARGDVVQEMRGLGYRPVDQSGGRVLFLPPRDARWVGRIWLEGDGSLKFVRPFLTWKGLEDASWIDPESTAAFSRDRPPVAGQTGWVLWPSLAVLEPSWEGVREAVEPSLDTYRKVLTRTALEERLQAIPGRLDRLWNLGEPLEGGAPLTSVAERREALLRYWATLPGTPEGVRAVRLVEGWFDEALGSGDEAFTEEEVSRAEAMRSDGRRLGSTGH